MTRRSRRIFRRAITRFCQRRTHRKTRLCWSHTLSAKREATQRKVARVDYLSVELDTRPAGNERQFYASPSRSEQVRASLLRLLPEISIIFFSLGDPDVRNFFCAGVF